MADVLSQVGDKVLLQAAAVILGAFIGGGSAVVAGYVADRRRFKREDKYRDYAERRQAYVAFLATWDAYERAGSGSAWGGAPFDQQVQRARAKERADAWLEFEKSFNAVLLIAPDEVRAAAWRLHSPGDSDEDDDPSGGDPFQRFVRAARKDLDK